MKIYQVRIQSHDEGHLGYAYFSNKADAERFNKKENESAFQTDAIEVEDVKLTKKGIIDILTQWAGHPDNG